MGKPRQLVSALRSWQRMTADGALELLDSWAAMSVSLLELRGRGGSEVYLTFAFAFFRSAQYFFMRSDTALRAAADIFRVRFLAL